MCQKREKNTFFEFLKKISNSGPPFLLKTAVTTLIEANSTKIATITTRIVANTSISSSSHLYREQQSPPWY